jgi:hypothetical protein
MNKPGLPSFLFAGRNEIGLNPGRKCGAALIPARKGTTSDQYAIQKAHVGSKTSAIAHIGIALFSGDLTA